MGMDLSTVILGLIMIFICIVPFVIMYYKKKGRENKMMQSLNKTAEQLECKISKHDFCGDFLLGIDDKRNFIFFCKQKKEEAIPQFVDLTNIQICHVVKQTGNVKNDIGNLGLIERVELSFISANNGKTETRFELYDEETNMQLSGELQFADKWAKQINDHLKNKKQ